MIQLSEQKPTTNTLAMSTNDEWQIGLSLEATAKFRPVSNKKSGIANDDLKQRQNRVHARE